MRATFSGLLTGLLTISVFAALCLLATPAEAADHRRCVTVREYRQVHVGQPARRAVRILDGYGAEGDLGRVYRSCPRGRGAGGGHVIIAFAGAPAIVTLKFRLGAGSDPWGRFAPVGLLLFPTTAS
jgi:hypothetical protein